MAISSMWERCNSKRCGGHSRLFPPSDLGLLDAPDRDLWQRPDLIMDAMGIADGSQVGTSAPAAAGSRSGSRAASARKGWSTRKTCSKR